MEDLKDLWSFSENDRPMRTFLMIISALIILALAYAWFKIFILTPVRNTAVKTASTTRDSLAPIVDTSKSEPVTSISVIKPAAKFKKEKIPKKENIMKQENVNGDNEINQNTGTNFGTIGGKNNSVTNNFKTQPRVVTKNILEDLIQNLPDKNSPISFYRTSSDDDEQLQFTNMLIISLQNMGYQSVGLGGIMSVGGIPKGKYFKYDDLMGTILVCVPKNN